MISIKTPEEIRIMAEGGKILAGIMKELKKNAKPGITTKTLDRLAESLILKSGGRCSFKGYEGFPACLCTSINEEIVHAVPSGRKITAGDIISLDLGILFKGFHTDMAVTLPVGKIEPEVSRLIRTAKRSLAEGIKEIKPGRTIGHLGRAVQAYAESQGFSVIRELCGHGIGREIHEDPQILNYFSKAAKDREGTFDCEESGPEIKEGMVLCLEPMIAVGGWRIEESGDGHGFKTADGSLSCHFEQTIAVTKNGAKVLTPWPL